MKIRPYRLAVVTSHPVQYQGPLFRRLAAEDGIDLTVFYGYDGSVTGALDPEFGIWITWDRPLLEGYRFVLLRHRSRASNALQRLAADVGIITHLWRERFDAVLIHSYATRLSMLAYVGALASRTPVMLRTESERLRPRRRWLEAVKQILLRPLFVMTSGFLVIGKANRKFFEHYGVKPSRQFFTPYSVDNDYFSRQRQRIQSSRAKLREAYGWTDDSVVIGFSGKLIPRKRVEDLIDAVAVLQREGLAVGLLIIGDGPSRPDLETRVGSQGVKWVAFAGFKNQSQLAACYVCLDVFALPSSFETWGLVLNEAMLFGLPVVASHMVGASGDLIEQGKNGYVFETGDVKGLTDALRSLVVSPAARREFGLCSEAIVQRYSYDACVRGILEGLHRVSRRRPSRTHAAHVAGS